MNDETDKRPDGALSLTEQAADWLLILGENANDQALLASFEAWRARSPDHRAAWERAQKAWSLVGHVPPAFQHVWNDPHRQASRPTAPAPRRRRWGRAAFAAAAAGLSLCLLLLMLPTILLHALADHVTAPGESRTIELSDGSTVELGGDSAVRLDFTENRREVAVLAGEAFFDVAHMADRPFIVDAGGARVEVLGTAFNVRLSAETTEVALARGAIRASFATGGRASEKTLSPGQMVAIDRDTGAMSVSDVAIEDIGAWRDGRLYVVDATIGSVVEQLRRYHSAWIAIPDGTLARQRVTGVYDLRDPDRALRALIAPYGGALREVTPLARVVTR